LEIPIGNPAQIDLPCRRDEKHEINAAFNGKANPIGFLGTKSLQKVKKVDFGQLLMGRVAPKNAIVRRRWVIPYPINCTGFQVGLNWA